MSNINENTKITASAKVLAGLILTGLFAYNNYINNRFEKEKKETIQTIDKVRQEFRMELDHSEKLTTQVLNNIYTELKYINDNIQRLEER